MDSKINTGTRGLRIKIDQSRRRQAPRTDFGSLVSTGLNRTAGAVMDAGQLAAPFIPGGAVLSAAISGVGSLKSAAAGQSAGSSTGVAVGVNSSGLTDMSGAVNTVAATSGNATVPTGNTADPFSSGRQFLEMQSSFNMKYLMLQQQMQSENRQFTTLSNVMKTKHDTAKNAISNVR